MSTTPNHSIYHHLKTSIVGRPLPSDNLQHEKIPKWQALAVLSSDALSSVAYATEEVLIPLSVFATAAVAWSMPIALAIALLLVIITISYRQTIDAYPNGGGAYTVAKENIGMRAGLVAGAALLIDYTLTVSVSVAAGVENLTSAIPHLSEHKVLIGIFIILILMFLNLRGLKESATIFAFPTYLFVVSIVLMIIGGAIKVINGEIPNTAPIIHEVYPAIPIFLLLKAFSSGCAALTGIEAISNGIPIFRNPAQRNAKITMVWMSVILGGLFLGITLLAHLFGIIPKDGETTVSLLASTVFGRTGMYFVVQFSTALILFLAANTSYAGFPLLASLLARDRYLPRQLGSLGDRLVFSNGILGLSIAAAILIYIFQGDTHLLIPLYAVGVFLSFTLSQAGMVLHHKRTKHAGWRRSLVFNFIGAITTLVVLCVIAITKFMSGAWMVVLFIPTLVFFFQQIRSHYVHTAKQLATGSHRPTRIVESTKHIAIVPISGIHPGVIDALQYAASISNAAKACYVDIDSAATSRLQDQWKRMVPDIPLIILKSPFRSVIAPILEYIDEVQEKLDGGREMANDRRQEKITVVIPEFVTKHWYHKFLHNQTAILLYASLRGKKNVIVTSVRYHLDA